MPPEDRRPTPPRLDVVVADTRGRRLRMGHLSCWLQKVAPPAARGSVSIALVSDERVRELNRRYRWKDYATDVLSFPAESSPPPRTRRRQKSKPVAPSVSSVLERFLGDIVIARGVARRQAREAGHSHLTELKVLALHGLLHLLGYDHEGDDGQMRRVEERLRCKGGLPAGLIRRRSAVDTPAGAAASPVAMRRRAGSR